VRAKLRTGDPTRLGESADAVVRVIARTARPLTAGGTPVYPPRPLIWKGRAMGCNARPSDNGDIRAAYRSRTRTVRRTALRSAASALVLLAFTGGMGGVAFAGVVPGYPYSHNCPSVKLSGFRYDVTVLKGNVGCQTARTVLKDFLSGKGKMHGNPNGPAYQQTWTLDGGWSCGHGAGGGACIKGGSNYKNARQFINGYASP
jgi:hypothetical protein